MNLFFLLVDSWEALKSICLSGDMALCLMLLKNISVSEGWAKRFFLRGDLLGEKLF